MRSFKWIPVLGAILGLVVVAAAAAVLYVVDPARQPIFPICQFHALTGLYCPGCGATRATPPTPARADRGGILLQCPLRRAAARTGALGRLVGPAVVGRTADLGGDGPGTALARRRRHRGPSRFLGRAELPGLAADVRRAPSCLTQTVHFVYVAGKEYNCDRNMASTTLSIRVPAETKRWLEKFSRSRGSLSSAAGLLIEEARRHEQFRGVEFRDSPQGRLAFVQGTRVAVYFAWMTARDYRFETAKVAEHFGWPLWKVESFLAYAKAFQTEITQQVEEHAEIDDEEVLRRLLPRLRVSKT